MGRYIPEDREAIKYLWSVELFFDQWPRKFGSNKCLKTAATSAEAIDLALESCERQQKEITMVRCNAIAPESYDLIKERVEYGSDTGKGTRHKDVGCRDTESAEIIS